MISSHPTTVRADGMVWPLRTYCAAYGMVAVDQFARPSFDSQVRVIALCNDGAVTEPRWADQVLWHDVLAYRLLDGPTPAEPCICCGSSSDPNEICGDCHDDMEWGS
ncbi:hypothetical protein [Sphingomonas sp. BK235]|uniref:hypothetical protein n=1 Tax=Sphingomonas sp. BK235 TaxID=2512131 RepID=UPI0010D618E1|nr:hypothetical protein [Sphingomonas sp. BK235]TCP33245.1 hypothetical protein EV292_106187 [Sphingomonas sp. BK235]